jgi:hypothetical protein
MFTLEVQQYFTASPKEMSRLIHLRDVAGVTRFELLSRNNVVIGELLVYCHQFQDKRENKGKPYGGLLNGAGELAIENSGLRKYILLMVLIHAD